MMDRMAAFHEQGYCIVEGCISRARIERVRAAYARQIVSSLRRFLRQSHYPHWQPHRFTPQGHVIQSLLDVHDESNSPFESYPEFVDAVRGVLCNPSLLAVLADLSCASNHILVQSMMFDANTHTPPHQDGYYLDSIPGGRLIGAWVALEDIDEGAGRFYVVSGSHRIDHALTPTDLADHNHYLEKMAPLVRPGDDRLRVPPLRAGDAIFWNSWTVHGSLETCNPIHSRKSLTGHYLPASLSLGSFRQSRAARLELREIDGMRINVRRHHPPRLTLRQAASHAVRLLRSVPDRATAVLRRD